MPEKRKILVLLNPISGRGRGIALRKWEIAKPMVALGHVEATVRPTEHQNHA